jgi:molybdopterin molybdotransferase
MSSIPRPAGIVSFEEARRIVEEYAAKTLSVRVAINETEIVDLLAARGRVLAEPISADRDFPPFARATRDGYAVRAADVQTVPTRLEVVAEIKAGDDVGSITIHPGQAASIMTGASLPAGAEAVVMVEYTSASGRLVEIQRSIASSENFVPRGAEAHAGKLLVDQGRRMDHTFIATAAAVGKSRLQVFRKPRVAVLSTGDEIVEINAAPAATQIRNSNSYSLAAQIEEAGGEAVRLPIAPDEPKHLRQLIEDGLKYDLLLMTGGVSMGKYDLVEQVLAEMNAKFYFTGARIQPGKPIVFGSCSSGSCSADTPVRVQRANEKQANSPRHFFGLPGNPVSTMVTFRLFAQPMIAALAGALPQPLIFLKARLKSEVRTKSGLTRFLPAILSGEFADTEVELASWQGSGDLAALARANCYLVVPPEPDRIPAGESVSVLLP